MVESKVKEQGLAGDWLEVRRELDQIGLLAHKGGVKAEGLQSVAQGLNRGGVENKRRERLKPLTLMRLQNLF